MKALIRAPGGNKARTFRDGDKIFVLQLGYRR